MENNKNDKRESDEKVLENEGTKEVSQPGSRAFCEA
jgi:hypothetical protein